MNLSNNLCLLNKKYQREPNIFVLYDFLKSCPILQHSLRIERAIDNLHA